MNKLQITKQISLLEQHKFPYCNSLLIEDDIVALIDAGFGNELIIKFLKENRIDILITSHAHPDHVAGNSILSDISSAEIFVPEQDTGLSQSLEKLKKRIGIYGKPVENAWDIIVKDTIDFQGDEYGHENSYRNGHIFDLGKVKLRAVYAPGHSEGHYCFCAENEDLFFASDLGIDSFGPWYGYLDSNLSDYIKTLESIKKNNIGKCLSSHFDNVIYDIDIWLEKCLDIIAERKNKIVRFVQNEPMSIVELAKKQIIYNNIERLKWPMNEFVTHFEQNMIRQHLKLLLNSGKVKQENGNYFAA